MNDAELASWEVPKAVLPAVHALQGWGFKDKLEAGKELNTP